MIDYKKFIPRGKWVLVKDEPRPELTPGGIALPQKPLQIENVSEGTGHILKVGSDRDGILKACGTMLEPGMRIMFRGFLKDAFHEFTTDEDGLRIFILRAEDIMAIIDEDVRVGEFR